MNRSDLENAKKRISKELSELSGDVTTKEDAKQRIRDIEGDIDRLKSEKRRWSDKLSELPSEDEVDEDERQSERERLKDERRRINQYINDHYDGGDTS